MGESMRSRLINYVPNATTMSPYDWCRRVDAVTVSESASAEIHPSHISVNARRCRPLCCVRNKKLRCSAPCLGITNNHLVSRSRIV